MLTQLTFGERLREVRMGLKLQQKEMADGLGVAVSTYRAWEYGIALPDPLKLAELTRRIQDMKPNPLPSNWEAKITKHFPK